MADIRIVAEDELRPVLDVLTKLEWPIPFDQAPNIINQLGWTLLNAQVARSTLPVSPTLVGIGQLGGELSDIDFGVSDGAKPSDVSGKAAVLAAFPAMVGVVSSCMGFDPTGSLRASAGVRWDLPNQGRVNLPQEPCGLVLQVWSKRMADIDRALIRQGIEPGHEDEVW